MTLMPHVDAVLVFDASDAEETGEYEVFSITPAAAARDDFWSGWEIMREGLTSTGRMPTSDVEFDEETGFRLHAFGIERFATAT
jgi:hypothetical protein